MQNLKILNKKEIRNILNRLEEHFGIKKIELDYGFLEDREGKLFLISKDLSKVDTNELRINSLGLYFARTWGGIRLSIEGSQMVGNKATKNVIEVSKEDAAKWMNGEDLEIKADVRDFVIVKHNGDYLGCGKHKEGKILNFVPKARRAKWAS